MVKGGTDFFCSKTTVFKMFSESSVSLGAFDLLKTSKDTEVMPLTRARKTDIAVRGALTSYNIINRRHQCLPTIPFFLSFVKFWRGFFILAFFSKNKNRPFYPEKGRFLFLVFLTLIFLHSLFYC